MDVAEVADLFVRGYDSRAPARPDIRLEAEPLQNPGALAVPPRWIWSAVFCGFLEQRRVERAELLTLEKFDRRDCRDHQDRPQHRGPING